MITPSSPLSAVRFGLLAACAFVWTATALAENKQIDLKIMQVEGKSKIQFTNSACSDKPDEKGCVEADYGNAPILMWELDKDSNKEWQLARMQFSPDGEHWGDPAYPLADCSVKAFDLTPGDKSSGIASTARVEANGRMLQIFDRNEEVCMTHYKIFAMPRAGGPEIDSDPMIDNRGGGNP